MQRLDSIPCISISAGKIALYSVSMNRKRSRLQRMNEVNLKTNDHGGKISSKARLRVSNAIDWMLYMAVDKQLYPHSKSKKRLFKLNFVTLTLASKQVHDDREIKSKLLNQFLIEMSTKYGVNRYLWRAEAQRNGNIHFHVVTDKFIPWNELRNMWNRIQNKLGYHDRFQEKYAGKVANSTDIHSIWKIKNLGAYLAKYCTKESKSRKIEGKQWGLSNELSKLKQVSEHRYYEIEDEVRKLFHKFRDRVKEYDYATVIYVGLEEWMKEECKEMRRIVNDYLKTLGLQRQASQVKIALAY